LHLIIASIIYDLIECFERRQLSAFPLAFGDVNRNPEKHLFVHANCVYQLPESYDSTMIQTELDKCIYGTI